MSERPGEPARQAQGAHRRPRCRSSRAAPARSTAGSRVMSSAISSSSSVGAPKESPRAAAATTPRATSGMRVAEDHRAPRAHVVDVAVAVRVDEPCALALAEEDGRAADGAEGAHRRVHAAGDDALRGFKELLAAFVHGNRLPCRRVVRGRARPRPRRAHRRARRSRRACRRRRRPPRRRSPRVMPPIAAIGMGARRLASRERGEARADGAAAWWPRRTRCRCRRSRRPACAAATARAGSS